MAIPMFNWLRHFFGGERGDREAAHRVDPTPGSFYAGHVRRYRSGGDLVTLPEYVWSSASYMGRRGGLQVHLEELAESLKSAIYSDLMVILSPEDWRRSREDLLRPWEQALQAEVDHGFTEMQTQHGWTLATPSRPLRVRAIADGGPEMDGNALGLATREFATVALPNLYSDPTPSSRPSVEVFVRLPGQPLGWVGTLFDDQLAFTIGCHWLDNVRLPNLPASAAYTLHRYPGDTAINHHLSLELAESVALRVVSDARTPGKQSVALVDLRTGAPLVEVQLVPAAAAEVSGPRVGERDSLPSRDEPLGTLVPDDPVSGNPLTFIPETAAGAQLVLSERAYLIQKVHFGDAMTGYTLDLGLTGEVAPSLKDPAARFRVEGLKVGIESLRRDLILDDVPLRQGQQVPLSPGDHRLTWPGMEVACRSLEHTSDRRWPYLAEVRTPQRSYPIGTGESVFIGRDKRACAIALPDRPGHANIQWRREAQGAQEVRIRGGAMPKDRLTTDAILVANRHAEVDLRDGIPRVRAASGSCPTFVRKTTGEVLRLVAAEGTEPTPLQSGDELLVGNSAFKVIVPGQPMPSRDGLQAFRPGPRTQDLQALVALDASRRGVDSAPGGNVGESGTPAPALGGLASGSRAAPSTADWFLEGGAGPLPPPSPGEGPVAPARSAAPGAVSGAVALAPAPPGPGWREAHAEVVAVPGATDAAEPEPSAMSLDLDPSEAAALPSRAEGRVDPARRPTGPMPALPAGGVPDSPESVETAPDEELPPPRVPRRRPAREIPSRPGWTEQPTLLGVAPQEAGPRAAPRKAGPVPLAPAAAAPAVGTAAPAPEVPPSPPRSPAEVPEPGTLARAALDNRQVSGRRPTRPAQGALPDLKAPPAELDETPTVDADR